MSHLWRSAAAPPVGWLSWRGRGWLGSRGSVPWGRRLWGGPPGSAGCTPTPGVCRVGRWGPPVWALVGSAPEGGGPLWGRPVSGPPPRRELARRELAGRDLARRDLVTKPTRGLARRGLAVWGRLARTGLAWGARRSWGLVGSTAVGGRPEGPAPARWSGRLGFGVGPRTGGPPSPPCSRGSGGWGRGRPCVSGPPPGAAAPREAREPRRARRRGWWGTRCCSGPGGGRPATLPPGLLRRTGPSPGTGTGRPGTRGPGSRVCRSRRRCLSSRPCATWLCRSRPPAGEGGWRHGTSGGGSPVSGLGGRRRSRGGRSGQPGSGPPPRPPSPTGGDRCGRSGNAVNRRERAPSPATLGRPPGGRRGCGPGGGGTREYGTRSPCGGGPARPGR